jgi:hypothetical protein
MQSWGFSVPLALGLLLLGPSLVTTSAVSSGDHQEFSSVELGRLSVQGDYLSVEITTPTACIPAPRLSVQGTRATLSWLETGKRFCAQVRTTSTVVAFLPEHVQTVYEADTARLLWRRDSVVVRPVRSGPGVLQLVLSPQGEQQMSVSIRASSSKFTAKARRVQITGQPECVAWSAPPGRYNVRWSINGGPEHKLVVNVPAR